MKTMKFDNIAEFKTQDWQQKMAKCGESMQANKVQKVVFASGTFVGNDPFGIFRILEDFGVLPVITDEFKDILKKVRNKAIDDLGNFAEDYIPSFTTGINHGIECCLYPWSSENNHIGRLLAVPGLAARLAEVAEGLSKKDRILMIGYSHAGQIFALLTIFLENGEKANELYDVLADVSGFDKEALAKNIEKISNIYLDIVLLGAPVRYPWGNYEKFRLLNIINHRSASSLAGVLETRDGDYVQQWGTEGTDLPSDLDLHNDCNNRLNPILDKGLFDPSELVVKLKETKRRQAVKINGDKAGNTLLVDYLDNGSKVFQVFGFIFGKPNCIKTVLGHGIYTRRNCMLFNTNVIVENFYSS